MLPRGMIIKDLLIDQAKFIENEMTKASEDLSFIKFGSAYLRGFKSYRRSV
jgi:hypothetical protein